MANSLTENTKEMLLSTKDYQTLLDAYQKIGKVLTVQKEKKKVVLLKTLYGIWKNAKVNEVDFKKAENSLFKTSL